MSSIEEATVTDSGKKQRFFIRKPKAFIWGVSEKSNDVIDIRAVAAEFVALCFLVVIGCGSACANGAFDGATTLLVAFGFGMAILVLVKQILHPIGSPKKQAGS